MEEPNYRVVQGQKEGNVLYSKDSYFYSICRRSATTVYLLCHKQSCNGRAQIRGRTLTHSMRHNRVTHNHRPEFDFEQVSELVRRIKERVRTENGPIRTIFDEECNRVPRRVRRKIIFARLEKTLGNIRRNIMGNIPHTFDELDHRLRTDADVHDRFARANGQPFYRGMCGRPGHRSLVFVTDEGLRILNEAVEVAADGTFRSRPDTPDSRQLFIIGAVMFGYTWPVVYVLMESKSRGAYEAVFNWLRYMLPRWHPRRFHCDFEIALLQALAVIFIGCILLGCWFHYRQCLVKKKRALGLEHYVRNNMFARHLYRRLGCLPLAPAAHIPGLLAQLEQYAIINGLRGPGIRALLRYVRNTWLRKYGAEVISVYRESSRCNNAMENINRQFNSRMRVRRPNVFTFLGETGKFALSTCDDFDRAVNNRRISRNATARTNEVNEVIEEAQLRLHRGEYNPWQFLCSVTESYNELFDEPEYDGSSDDDD